MELMNPRVCAACPVQHNAMIEIADLETENDENIMTCMGNQPEQQAKIIFEEEHGKSAEPDDDSSINEISHRLRGELGESIEETNAEIISIKKQMGEYAVKCAGPVVFQRTLPSGQYLGVIVCASPEIEDSEGFEPVCVVRQSSASSTRISLYKQD
ncbi:MAG: hypothetical protein ABIQ04_01475 [Candidatus Saccharimonadales bacterium]